MQFTRQQTMLLAAAGSGALLLGALGFQSVGYAPCDLCVLQRWPHLAAVVIGVGVWVLGGTRAMAWLGALAAAIAFGLAAYHSGVEWRLWPGPATCTGASDIGSLSLEDLMARIQASPVVRCDDVQWRLFGLSMAAWNALISAGLVAVWLAAALGDGLRLRRSPRTQAAR